MASLFKVIGIALTAAAASLLLRTYRPELSVQIAVAAGTLLLLLTVDELKVMSAFLNDMFERTGIKTEYLKAMVKVLGIAYLAQFAADLCRDAGESAVAGKVELAGRVMILAISLPILGAILELVSGIVTSYAAV
ncbi:MAG: stage III sporulation protein AD [Clostridia bacterium]|nr:stage III sporulation protein AD [Clostridia bacterium]